jgi:hypothetical protein
MFFRSSNAIDEGQSGDAVEMVGRKSLGSPARVDAGIVMSRIRAGSSAQTCPFRNWYSTCTCTSDYWLHICEVLPQASSQQAMFCGENLLRFTARGRLGKTERRALTQNVDRQSI